MPLNPPQDFRKTRQIHRRGVASSKPSAADVLVGTLYYSTDSGVLERSNGTAWELYGSSGIATATGVTGSPPADTEEAPSDFYFINS